MREIYRQKGYSSEWIEKRVPGFIPCARRNNRRETSPIPQFSFGRLILSDASITSPVSNVELREIYRALA